MHRKNNAVLFLMLAKVYTLAYDVGMTRTRACLDIS